jgi:hypothetical protein
MTASDDTEAEKPLDPATERLRQKMMRLLVISIGIMMVGLMAVLGAIVYKVGSGPEPVAVQSGSAGVPVESGFEGRIDLPSGATVLSTAIDGDRILLQVQLADGRQELQVYSIADGRNIARIAVD